MREGELASLFACTKQKNSLWRHGYRRAGELRYLIGQDAGLSVGPICKLCESMKGPVLQNQRFRTAMIQGKNRILERIPGEDPMLIV